MSEQKTEQNDILQLQGVNDKGFGIMPKTVALDERLTVEAKGIYSYFCSFAGASKTAFPRREKILKNLGMSKDRYYAHFNLLKKYGYIKTEQAHKNGKLSHNIYTIMQVIPDKSTAAPITNSIIQCPKKQHTEKPYTENTDTNKNNSKRSENKQALNNIMPLQSSPVRQDSEVHKYEALIKENIGYRQFINPHHKALVGEMVSIMLDAIASKEPYIQINGERKPKELVKSQLLKLQNEHIIYVIDRFKGLDETITKRRKYLLSMLYNSSMEMESYYMQN